MCPCGIKDLEPLFQFSLNSCSKLLQHECSMQLRVTHATFIMWRSIETSLDILVDTCLLDILFSYFDIFPSRKILKIVRWAKSYPSEKLSPKPHFLLRHFLTFSIIARIIYALMCQTCYIRYHKIYSAKFKQKRKRIFFVDYILAQKKRF